MKNLQMKKFTLPCLIVLLALTVAGCAGSDQPKASFTPLPDPATPTPVYSEAQPNISNPDGELIEDYDGQKAVEGAVVSLTEDEIVVKAQGAEYTLTLSDEAKRALSVFQNHGRSFDPGTMLLIPYTEDENGAMTATSLEYLQAN